MVALYVHWPFCKKKCPYCDFNSHVRRDPIDENAYKDALIADLKYDASRIQSTPISSIFFGGGTPSLMCPSTVEALIDTAQNLFSFTNDIEITLEANPTSTESEKFKGFKNAGVNRVSLGVQSLNDEALQRLGREHSAIEALRAVEIAQNTFDRWSFDMMYAREGQTLDDWSAELSQAVGYIGGHISLYQLTMEDGTDFKRKFDKGELILPDEDVSTDMYIATGDVLKKLGYNNYEVSNYAKEGDESLHNLTYWNYGDYIGVGAGAHGRITTEQGKLATVREKIPEKWKKNAPHNLTSQDILNIHTQAQEAILMGMRLSTGVAEQKIIDICGMTFDDIFDTNSFNVCLDQGLLIREGGVLKASPQGRLNLNAVLGYIF